MIRKLVLVTVALALSGCGMVRNGCKGLASEMVMLDTTITLYACDGDTLEVWHTRASVQSNGGEAWWVDDNNVQHHISGTFTIRGR